MDGLGNSIKRTRERRGMNQKTLASLAGIAQQTLSAYESDSKTPTLDKLIKLAEVLEVSLDDLVRPDRAPEFVTLDTLGDVALMICNLDLAECIAFGEITRTYEIENNGDLVEACDCIPAVGFVSQKLAAFVTNYRKMKELLDDKTIDAGLFDQWLSGCFADLGKHRMTEYSKERE